MNLTIDKSVSITPAWIMDAMEVGPTWTNPVQSRDWATDVCAAQISARYGGKVVGKAPYYPEVELRVMFSPSTMNFIRFIDPTTNVAFYSNAGYLAKVWERYVTKAQTANPDLADHYVQIFVQEDEDYQAWLGTL